jgi:hypothetical protein
MVYVLYNLLNVLVQIENKMELKKKCEMSFSKFLLVEFIMYVCKFRFHLFCLNILLLFTSHK